MAGNAIRCVGKYLYDKRIVKKEYMTIETDRRHQDRLLLYTRNGKANTISVGMGKADLDATSPAHRPSPKLHHHQPAGGDCRAAPITSPAPDVGNPHCVVFCRRIPPPWTCETVRAASLSGRSYFPERINTEFVRIVNRRHPADAGLRTGQWGNAWPAAPAPAPLSLPPQRMAFVEKGKDITVQV